MAQTARQSAATTGTTEKKLSGIYDGEYFEILHRQDDTLFVKCTTCGPDGLQLRASAKSNGNILKHVKRRHPELLAKIREEKHIKTRGSIVGQNASYSPAEKKPKTMSFKTEEILFVDQNHDSDCMTSSYITTSAPDEKSPFAANVMVHLQPQPILATSIDNQHPAITSQHTHGGAEHSISTIGKDEDDGDDDEDQTEEEGQQDCENIEYLSTNMHHDAGILEMNSVGHEPVVRHRSILVSTSGGPVTAGHSSSTGIRNGMKRRLELPRIDDDDDADDHYEETNPLEITDDLPTGQTFFGAQPSRFPSVNRTVDNDREIVALRKKLMMREFELVQQKHLLEIEVLQKDLLYKRAQHQKIIECLNKQLRK